MLLAAAAEPNRGWGGPVAILIAFVIFRVVVMPVGRWVLSKIQNPSPTPALPTAERVKVKATVGVTPNDTIDTDRIEEYSWGAIGYERPETTRERMRRLAAQARQVVTTGSHVLPDPEPGDESDEDPAIDLALDDDPEQAAEPADPIAEYINHADRLQIPYGQMVKVLMDTYSISMSTAKIRIRKVRAARS